MSSTQYGRVGRLTPMQHVIAFSQLYLRRIGLSLVIVAAALALGLIASRHTAPAIVLVLLSGSTLIVLLAWRPGIAIGLLVLGVLNGLPFVNTATTIIDGSALANYMTYLLITMLVVRWVATRRSSASTTGTSPVIILSIWLAVWWLITVVRSTEAGIPFTSALSYGRGFFTFALLLALCPLGLRLAADRRDALLVLCVGAIAYAVGEIVTVTGHNLAWLVHPVIVRTSEVGLTRVYAFMAETTVLLFSMALGATLLATSHSARRRGQSVILIAGIAILLQQTRAMYLGIAVALLLIVGLWVVRVPASRTILGRRSVKTMLVILSLIVALAAIDPQALTKYGELPLLRLTNAYSELSSSTGNVGYRLNLTHSLLNILHGQVGTWITGVGFLDPRYRYFTGLPHGSILNSDIGLIDGIVVVGLTGVVLIYSIILLTVRHLVRTTRFGETRLPPDAWLIFGISVWLTQALVSSYTLPTFFQPQGQVLTAFIVGIALNICRQEPDLSPSPKTGQRPPLADVPACLSKRRHSQ